MRSHAPLERLSALAGILPRYVDQTGSETRVTTDATRVALLDAMGIDASTPESAEQAIDSMQTREWSRAVSPVRVVRASAAEASQLTVRLAEGGRERAEWELELELESGAIHTASGTAQPEWNGTFSIPIGFDQPPEGYHRVRVAARQGAEQRSGEQLLIVTPDACPGLPQLAGRDHVFGIIANLYTVRSGSNWGVGDLGDLARLAEWTAGEGGSFVGLNPLHALRNRGLAISPYSPVSRLYRNPIYIDVAAVPEAQSCAEARELTASAAFRTALEEVRAAGSVRYEEVLRLKMRALRVLHAAFSASHASGGGDRGREYRAFLDRQGLPLQRFATFEALVEKLGSGSWRDWPATYHEVDSSEVVAFAEAHADEIGFHCWLQFELDRQLGEAAKRGRAAGLSLGLYQDLAIGASPDGADTWAYRHLFLDRVSVGAPPDDYSASGQNWGLPPLDPLALVDDAYAYWIDLVRGGLRHGGALRIDHVIGLFRQFWIPAGRPGSEGAYVRFPADDLLGILALEAARHRAIIVGEDLGTVPPDVPPALHERGIFSSRVFYFERDGDEFRSAADYEPMALATANTHDMPTLAGFWRGRDIEVKRDAGIIESEEEAREQRRRRALDRESILRRLAEEGLLTEAVEPESEAELRGAIHAFLCRSPAALVGFSLDDLVGEMEAVNVPSAPAEKIESWTRKLATPLESLSADPEVRAALRCEGRGASGK